MIESLYYGETIACQISISPEMLEDMEGKVKSDYLQMTEKMARRALAEKLVEQLEIQVREVTDWKTDCVLLQYIWRPKCKKQQVIQQLSPEDGPSWSPFISKAVPEPALPSSDPVPEEKTVVIELNPPRKLKL